MGPVSLFSAHDVHRVVRSPSPDVCGPAGFDLLHCSFETLMSSMNWSLPVSDPANISFCSG